MHDRSYRDFNQIKDKKVAVIGFGKTALDLSVQAGTLI
jgi:cation diffusion facilitator CzcD-associated flavoprotein CzcO